MSPHQVIFPIIPYALCLDDCRKKLVPILRGEGGRWVHDRHNLHFLAVTEEISPGLHPASVRSPKVVSLESTLRKGRTFLPPSGNLASRSSSQDRRPGRNSARASRMSSTVSLISFLTENMEKDLLKFAVKLFVGTVAVFAGGKLVKNGMNDARRIGSSTTKKG